MFFIMTLFDNMAALYGQLFLHLFNKTLIIENILANYVITVGKTHNNVLLSKNAIYLIQEICWTVSKMFLVLLY